MTLTSLYFFAFVLVSIVIYYIIPKKCRWIVLLAASVAFYAIVCLRYMPFIAFTAGSTWLGAIWLHRVITNRKDYLKEHKKEWDSDTKKAYKHTTMVQKRLILILVLVLNFGILGALKYYNFVADWITGIIGGTYPVISILLPLGISFYTFQSMGYIIDIYWEKGEPERNFAKFALFVTFFPQIVQGPISLYSELAPRLYEGHDINYENLKKGFQLMLWGLFKKMIIADRMVMIVNTLLTTKNDYSNFASLLLVLVYTFQLYADFSGGIDIIRGVAQMFGIEMAKNFERPFFSKSVSEFWRRWHISLGRWLKTYLFYPIAVSRAFLRFGTWIASKSKSSSDDIPEDSLWGGFTFLQHLGRVLPGCIATLITFFVIGMWHGANWRYAGFGLWNGIFILFAMLLDPVFRYTLAKLKIDVQSAGWKFWRIIRTFVIVVLSFAFDLGDDFADSWNMVLKCITPSMRADINQDFFLGMGLTGQDYLIICIGLLIMLIVSIYQEKSQKSIRDGFDKHQLLSWIFTLGCFFAVLLFGLYGPGVAANEFVYMQF